MNRILLFVFVFVSMLRPAMGQTGHFIPSDFFSSGLISSICQDKYGSIWIATDYGLNRYDGYRFQTFLHRDDDPWSLCDNTAVSLLCDKKGRLWVGTAHGLDCFDDAAEGFRHYPFPGGLRPRVSTVSELADGRIVAATAGYGAFVMGSDGQLVATREFADSAHSAYYGRVYEDAHGCTWKTGFDSDVVLRSKGRFKTVQVKGEPVGIVECSNEVIIVGTRGIISFRGDQPSGQVFDLGDLTGKDVLFSAVGKDADDNIYIGTRGHGIYFMPCGTHRLERYEANIFGANINSATAKAILADRHGNLWIGLQRKGLAFIPQRPMQFSNWNFEAQKVPLGSPLSSVCDGDNGMTWCTVQGVGIYGFDSKGRIVAHPSAPAAVEFIFRDKQQRFWVGTDDGLFSYNPLTGAYQQKVQFECDKFNDMTSDNQGNIYISTFSRGFCVYNPQTGELTNYRNDNRDTVKTGHLCNDWIMCMTPDRDGIIWMGTSSGVSCFDPRTKSFLSHGWNQLLNGVICFSICELKDGNIAIGTDRGLYLYNHQQRKVERFPDSQELDDKMVNYIVQSNDGDLWCSTSVGIWHYDFSEHVFTSHVSGNGLMKKEYLYGVGLHTDDDMIYFGHDDGLTVFSPQSVKENRLPLDSLRLSAFFVGSQAVNTRTVLNGVQITDRAVTESSYFTLSYLDHTVTLAFSQFNFDNPMNVSYEYRVNNGEWLRNPNGKNEITLSHLQPGTYRIAVRASMGNDYTPEKVVVITVRAPWYRSMLAYFIYFVILAALGAYILRAYRRRANEQMNEEKMKFLINATHDIRSPLTLIMSPLANLKRRLPPDQTEAQRDVNTIEHNATRILNLVNQILDVRKIDKQQMHLHCEQTDRVSFIQGIYKMFEYNAQERNIEFNFLHEGLDELQVWVDRGQFDKVVSNLLSNAFKYSYDGGKIEIRLSADGQQATIEVIDNGIGVDSESLRHIFDRFYQGNNSRRMHIDGTGIGLNLCKMIVDMHHGTIKAQNRTDGRGTVMSVTLPLGNSHLKPEEMEASPSPAPHHTSAATQHASPSSRYRVLVVDDDQEIGHYISSELSRYYKFTTCSNGREGLKELLTNDYDCVVSDVMMPEMDGFTMLRMIKTNANISHIPVIMLTSKADVGNRLEGLERGADAFLAKPFDMEELHMNIENQIHNRQRLKGKFSGAQQQAARVEQVEVKGNDEALMERIMKVVNENLSNSDFNVDMLTQEVGISRAQLHRKMKDITGISTSEFIRNIRLEQAARLLKEQKVNVTQVAYAVGFSNLAHFSTVFRKHFGMSPSEYVEKNT